VQQSNASPATMLRFAALALPLLLAACSFLPGASLSPRELALRALATRQSQWAAAELDDYVLTIERQCFCPETSYEITVTDGVVTKVTHGGAPAQPAEVQGLPKTVPELFALVAGQPPEAGLKVEYDADRGFPTRIEVDPIQNAIDDEYTILVKAFTVS
jgi:Family of unknown function (DUF6174)